MMMALKTKTDLAQTASSWSAMTYRDTDSCTSGPPYIQVIIYNSPGLVGFDIIPAVFILVNKARSCVLTLGNFPCPLCVTHLCPSCYYLCFVWIDIFYVNFVTYAQGTMDSFFFALPPPFFQSKAKHFFPFKSESGGGGGGGKSCT